MSGNRASIVVRILMYINLLQKKDTEQIKYFYTDYSTTKSIALIYLNSYVSEFVITTPDYNT